MDAKELANEIHQALSSAGKAFFDGVPMTPEFELFLKACANNLGAALAPRTVKDAGTELDLARSFKAASEEIISKYACGECRR